MKEAKIITCYNIIAIAYWAIFAASGLVIVLRHSLPFDWKCILAGVCMISGAAGVCIAGPVKTKVIVRIGSYSED